MEEKIIEIAKFYGRKAQSYQLIEEMSELTKELLKNNNRNKDNIKEITEEIADVEFMLLQVKYLYGIDECDIIDKKNRSIKKLEKQD